MERASERLSSEWVGGWEGGGATAAMPVSDLWGLGAGEWA